MTLLYEFRKDVVTCLLIGGALWLIENRRDRARQHQPAMPAQTPSASPPSGLASRWHLAYPH